MYTYIWICICIYMYVCVLIYTCVLVNLQTMITTAEEGTPCRWTHICVDICSTTIYTCIFGYVYVYTCMYMYLYTRVYICMYVQLFIWCFQAPMSKRPCMRYIYINICICIYIYICMYIHAYFRLCAITYLCMRRAYVCSPTSRGGGLGSRPKKMYGERLGDGVEYHLMRPTPRR